jgi:hypothetical protein
MLNREAGPNGRSAGSLTWAGLRNTYYWLDPVRQVTGLIMTQILPFADPQVLALYRAFERSVYAAIHTCISASINWKPFLAIAVSLKKSGNVNISVLRDAVRHVCRRAEAGQSVASGKRLD